MRPFLVTSFLLWVFVSLATTEESNLSESDDGALHKENEEFKLPKKDCELESERYSDGTKIETDCNSCLCASGHWVCNALKCDDENLNQPRTEMREEETGHEEN